MLLTGVIVFANRHLWEFPESDDAGMTSTALEAA
jgi:hypothetical protein